MPDKTTNLDLTKPYKEEQYNIDVFNNNFQKIDDFAKEVPLATKAKGLQDGAKINGVLFNGEKDVITGLGLWDETQTYAKGKIAYKIQNEQIASYISLQNDNTGNDPETSPEYWKLSETYIPLANSTTLGGIKTDGVTTQTDGNGVLSVKKATSSQFGITKPDNITTQVDSNGVLSVNTDFVNQSKAMETGNISNVPDIYADIENYAHSTFDLSKIKVVGNPVISDDGIASGFSDTNFIQTGSSSTTYSGNNFEIYMPPFLLEPSSKNDFICMGICPGEVFNVTISRHNSTTIQVYIYWNNGGSNYVKWETVGSYTDWIQFKIVVNGTSANLYKSVNGGGFEQAGDTQTIGATVFANNFIFGKHSANGYGFAGSIDFKQFSIKVDGVEVFSGNNTSVDIIKPDNYTVVGSPAITDDGIASGFSDNNYITVPTIKFSTAKTWEINFSFKTPKEFNLAGASGMGVYGKEALMKLDIRSSLELSWCFMGANLNWASHPSVKKVEADTLYFAKAYFNGTSYKLDLSTDGATYTNWITYNNANSILDTELGIGNNINKVVNETPFQGSIDLNSFKIYVDEKLIYQPCLKIPYTLSKTGSKIVDVSCRNRVQDVYEQFGYAPYYTLDEKNKTFTLPMGEIYGMIDRKVNSSALTEVECVIETYHNGASWYRVWSDGWCEQGGQRGAVDIDKTITITLLKKFRNSDYFVSDTNISTIATTNNSALILISRTVDSFILGVDVGSSLEGLWYACGYIEV